MYMYVYICTLARTGAGLVEEGLGGELVHLGGDVGALQEVQGWNN